MRNVGMLIMLCGIFFPLAARTSAEGYSPHVGQPHLDLTLPDLVDGKPVSLSQFRGRKVLLIHFASW